MNGLIIPRYPCDYCGEYASSPYTFRHDGVWYYGHKRCMGAPMRRKLTEGLRVEKSPPNIALCGKLRAGKDAAAEYLAHQYGYTRFAFGDELKRYANELFDVPPSVKDRELYQWFGQTVRQRDPDVWVRKCFEEITMLREVKRKTDAYRRQKGFPTSPFRTVITDLRQPNEYDRCRAEGYVIIRVTAPDGVRVQRAIDAGDAFTAADLAHETESHVSTFAVDYEIENGGALADLHAQIDAIMEAIRCGESTY
ncbi:adenylate kinase and related kinases [Paenibacillus elgii]|uniref:adenylate kinase and related kinases n=1 Tax=Paenibacillus elgii TaxID=189691 RepID=UPI000248C2F6|nr:adenylate kinase and related kinases [Paenibacillus elgii]